VLNFDKIKYKIREKEIIKGMKEERSGTCRAE
jgi:hypothetical protein